MDSTSITLYICSVIKNKVIMTSTFTENGTTYTTTKMFIKNTQYNVTVAKGKFNHVTVRKVTANPFGTLGTEFKNFNEAVSHYKNPSIKLGLTKIEMGLL